MTEVIIIGGGLAGLTAGRTLHEKGISFQLLEATDRVGGRVKTDVENGFRFDRGFQVLLTAYPEAKRWLDYKKLDLKTFLPGAMLLMPNGKSERIGDPLRDPSSLFATIFSSAGGLGDKFKILSLKTRLASMSIEQIFEQEEKTTAAVLKEDYGFSQKMIDQFFQPFFAGIFLEKELKTSRRMFDFVFKMFGEGSGAIPNLGMEEISKQLAAPITDFIKTNTRVEKIDGQTIHLSDGSTVSAPNIILATEATGLVKEYASAKKKFQQTIHLHFATDTPPIKKSIIALNTSQNRLTNNICVISNVAPGYAPSGKHLISISIVGKPDISEKEMVATAKKELKNWFGTSVEDWQLLKVHEVSYALPNQDSVTHQSNNLKIRDGLYRAGDWNFNGSINAAMRSGRLAAEAIFKENC